jgi:hypothetical protein
VAAGIAVHAVDLAAEEVVIVEDEEDSQEAVVEVSFTCPQSSVFQAIDWRALFVSPPSFLFGEEF